MLICNLNLLLFVIWLKSCSDIARISDTHILVINLLYLIQKIIVLIVVHRIFSRWWMFIIAKTTCVQVIIDEYNTFIHQKIWQFCFKWYYWTRTNWMKNIAKITRNYWIRWFISNRKWMLWINLFRIKIRKMTAKFEGLYAKQDGDE